MDKIKGRAAHVQSVWQPHIMSAPGRHYFSVFSNISNK